MIQVEDEGQQDEEQQDEELKRDVYI